MSFWIIVVFQFYFFFNIYLLLLNIVFVVDIFSGKLSLNLKKDFRKDFLNYYKKKKIKMYSFFVVIYLWVERYFKLFCGKLKNMNIFMVCCVLNI